jgi:hypothetical protein
LSRFDGRKTACLGGGKGLEFNAWEESLLKARPQRYECPKCKWDFAFRKKKRCPGCGTLLLIASDIFSDAELTELRVFWMWEPLKERWDYIRDWEEHKRAALKKFEEYTRRRGASLVEAEEMPRPPTRWIQ